MNNQSDAQNTLNGEAPQVTSDESAIAVPPPSISLEVAVPAAQVPVNTEAAIIVTQQPATNGTPLARPQPPTDVVKPRKQPWFRSHITGMMAIIIVLAALDIWIAAFQPALRLLIWLCYLVLLFSFIFILGHGIKGKWRGALIDSRNKISLSRLQTILWTVLILSAFLATAQSNISLVGPLKGMQIALPQQLWLLMGISVTSLIGTPLIQSYKKDNDKASDQTINTPQTMNQGVMIVNKDDDSARWSDMFKGEEIGNQNTLDLGKVQMFCFTILLIFAYALALGTLLSGPATAINTFPPIDNSIVALLGISHVGYLGTKATPHTPTIAPSQ